MVYQFVTEQIGDFQEFIDNVQNSISQKAQEND